MSRNMSNTLEEQRLDIPIIVWSEMKKKMLDQAVKMCLMARSKINGTMKTLSQNTIRDIIKKLGSPPWLTQAMQVIL
jgi:hypothetical protein